MDKLPESVLSEVLANVFGYLESHDLASASLVCKTWIKVIGNKQTLMAKLPLVLYPSRVVEVIESAALTRNYSTVFWKYLTIDQHLLTFSEKYGPNIHALMMKGVSVGSSLQCFVSIMENLHLLEKVDMFNLRVDAEVLAAPETENIIYLENLKELTVRYSWKTLFPFFFAPNLTSLKLRNCSMPYGREKFPQLESLVLQGCCTDSEMLLTCPIKKLSYNRLDLGLDVSPLGNLVHLELGCASTSKMLKDVYKSMNHLKLLHIHLHDGNANKLEDLACNRSIKTLIIEEYDCYNDTAGFEQIIHCSPEVEILGFDFSMSRSQLHQLLSVIAVELRKLRSLEIRSASCSSFEFVVFPSLLDLNILCNDEPIIQPIVKSCPNLQKLTIESFDFKAFSGDDVLQMTQLRNLQELNILGRIFDTKNMFDGLRNCPQLKSVTLRKRVIEENPAIIEKFQKNGPKLLLDVNRVSLMSIGEYLLSIDEEDHDKDAWEYTEDEFDYVEPWSDDDEVVVQGNNEPPGQPPVPRRPG